jgi:hypothetical protein
MIMAKPIHHQGSKQAHLALYPSLIGKAVFVIASFSWVEV